MKKVLQIIMAVTLLSGVVVGTAEAHGGCTISETGGPGSTNTCKLDNETTVDYTCNIDGTVTNSNHQTVNSGDAAVIDNTHGGSASSGHASNDNSTLTEIVASCATAAAPTPTPTPTPQPTPPVGGNGGGVSKPTPTTPTPGVVSGVTSKAPSAVAVLPDTGENDAMVNAAIAAGSIGTLAVLAQVATAMYRRRATNS